jgi:hypothetical protein
MIVRCLVRFLSRQSAGCFFDQAASIDDSLVEALLDPSESNGARVTEVAFDLPLRVRICRKSRYAQRAHRSFILPKRNPAQIKSQANLKQQYAQGRTIALHGSA